MTYEECLIEAKKIRKIDQDAGTERKKIVFLPTNFDLEKAQCLAENTVRFGYEQAFAICNYEGEDLSIYFYDPSTPKFLESITLAYPSSS